jgi:hypothetical protein
MVDTGAVRPPCDEWVGQRPWGGLVGRVNGVVRSLPSRVVTHAHGVVLNEPVFCVVQAVAQAIDRRPWRTSRY